MRYTHISPSFINQSRGDITRQKTFHRKISNELKRTLYALDDRSNIGIINSQLKAHTDIVQLIIYYENIRGAMAP